MRNKNKCKFYNPVSKENIALTLQLPALLIKDLTRRAEENGHTFQFELAIRLAQSLQRDWERDAADDRLALAAFETVYKN